MPRAKKLADLANEPWIYTGNSQQTGYAKSLFEMHGMPPPPSWSNGELYFGVTSTFRFC
jgi:hypothetical protein